MRLRPIQLGQVPLEGAALMDGTALMHQLLAQPGPQSFEQSTAPIGHEEDSAGERQAAMLKVPKERLTHLVILGRSLPEPEGYLLAGNIDPQGHEERLATPMDRVQKARKRRKVLQGPLLERLQFRRRQRHELA